MSMLRFVACSDVHGDNQDPEAVRVLLDFTKDYKPHLRIFMGDLWDFRAMRRKADESDKRESMREDFGAGLRFLTQWAPHHFLLGNHDHRLWYWREHGTGLVQDLASDGVADVEAQCRKIKCRIYPYHRRDGILKIGNLKFLHGFYCGITAARRHALVYGSCLFGHTHAISTESIPGLDQREGRNVGCLCGLDMEYDAHRPDGLRQQHGFAYGVINEKTGNYAVYQAQPLNGHWLLPTEFKAY